METVLFPRWRGERKEGGEGRAGGPAYTEPLDLGPNALRQNDSI